MGGVRLRCHTLKHLKTARFHRRQKKRAYDILPMHFQVKFRPRLLELVQEVELGAGERTIGYGRRLKCCIAELSGQF